MLYRNKNKSVPPFQFLDIHYLYIIHHWDFISKNTPASQNIGVRIKIPAPYQTVVMF